MKWIKVTDKPPLVHITGNFDGTRSDELLVEVESGKRYLATYYEGIIDGVEFKDWYSSPNDFEITEKITRYLEIPD